MKPTEIIFTLLGGWDNLRLVAGSLTWSDYAISGSNGYRLFQFDFVPVNQEYSLGWSQIKYIVDDDDGDLYLASREIILSCGFSELYHEKCCPVNEFWGIRITPNPRGSRLPFVFKSLSGVDLFPFGQ